MTFAALLCSALLCCVEWEDFSPFKKGCGDIGNTTPFVIPQPFNLDATLSPPLRFIGICCVKSNLHCSEISATFLHTFTKGKPKRTTLVKLVVLVIILNVN